MDVRVPPATARKQGATEAFRATLDMFQTGVDLMRQNLRRRHPEASHDHVERRLGEWLRERPGAASGDCTGHSVDLRTRMT